MHISEILFSNEFYFHGFIFATLVTSLLIVLGLLKISSGHNKDGPSLVTAVCIFTASLVCSPALLCILILLKTYRYSCHLYLKLNAAGAGDRYMGLLEGPDSFWTSDETISKGVINILALADFREKDCNKCIEIMQLRIKQRLLANLEDKYRKILFQRKTQKFGFTYWVQQKEIDIKDHVKLFKMDLTEETCTESDMKAAISGLCNLDLPHGNSTNWEVILLNKNVETEDGLLSPVLIRIHHSVGDGYALVDLFLNVLTDTEKNKHDMVKTDKITDENSIKETANNRNFTLGQHLEVSGDKRIQSSQGQFQLEFKPDSDHDTLESTNKKALSEFPLEKRCKSKSFTQNMAKVNWNSLKIKTRTFLNLQRDHNKNEKKNGTLISVNACTIANIDPENSTVTLKKETDIATAIASKEKQTKCNLTTDKSALILDLKMQTISETHGTLFMDDMYFTPLSPMKSSMMLDFFSCKSRIEPQKSLLQLQMFMIHSQNILNCLMCQLCLLLCRVKCFINLIIKEFSKIFFLPANMIIKRIDNNRLHNNLKPLTECKTISYVFDDNLLEMIKHIKTHKNVKFNEVVLRAVSDSLEMNFQDATESVTLIAPIPRSTERSSLKNDFTVCMFDLCIRALDKTGSIHSNYLELFKSYEPALTHYILKYMVDSIPHCLLRYVVKSRHSTLVLSNMMGPEHRIFFSGYEIRRLIFFVPNKDTTGVGITLLSYNNQLALGIIMDESLGEKSKDNAKEILENMKNSVYHMYAECFE